MLNIDPLIIIDIEASALGNDSYPIEIGIYSEEHSGSLLIKP
ncbi:hypothetical protein QWY82_10070 [Simiduia curdlanivorans]|uniref:Uncharacterized protein n=1 Tax=Simiduia curdlanivorans TaxID=1492769 RepID=A0ABV8V1M4_9GAMM|nr:hypothetical protein [Simiduia curdlanivorans]MDN3639155.1 hypothetical protein [Simiduia curdlanivorans]